MNNYLRADAFVRVILALGIFCLSAFEVRVVAQSGVTRKQPLAFSIRLYKNPCAGEKIELRGELRNISAKVVTINRNSLWKYFLEKSLDQSSSIGLKIPKTRSVFSHNFDDSLQSGDYTVLHPGEVYKDSHTINRNSDGFYSSAGKYSITAGYSQPRWLSKRRATLFVGEVVSNETIFEIKDCFKDIKVVN